MQLHQNSNVAVNEATLNVAVNVAVNVATSDVAVNVAVNVATSNVAVTRITGNRVCNTLHSHGRVENM